MVLSLQQIKLEIANVKLAKERAKLLVTYQMLRPSYMMPITVKRDGQHWVCMLESATELLECPVAYGSCPAQAMLNFDSLWNGIDHDFSPEANEEDEDEPL
jgi:hypothetical protein